MKIRVEPISNVLGAMLLITALAMYCCIPVSLYFESGDAGALFQSASITAITGIIFWRFKFKHTANVTKREGYLIVVLGWVLMGFFSALPYIFSGATDSVTDAVFESFSGLTTTGSTIFRDIEFQSKGILFWRSLTQWLGGMGIIVLTVALFPLLGIAGIELFVAEAPGPTSDKLHPRIKETAKRLWLIYVGLTVLLMVILYLEGMAGFDAINHALTTMATGGFSTKNDSIAYFGSPLIQYTIIAFMFIGGTNYTLLYFGLKGRFKKVWASDEFRFYIQVVAIATLFTFLGLYLFGDYETESAFRGSLFSVVSIITTSGFVVVDYTAVTEWLTLFTFLLIFVGACAGSTAGGIKLVRHLVFFKNSIYEFKRLLHPKAMIRMKLNKVLVPPRIITHILVFLLFYLISFLMGALIISMMGMDFLTAIGASATCISNVGPGIGEVGPVNNFADVPAAAKWVLSFLMVLGRLELFTVLILFTPYFWKVN